MAFSEIGKKDNQEDSVYPSVSHMSETDRLFVLCDGMGGHENGEVASQTVCDAFEVYMSMNPVIAETDIKTHFLSALDYAYDRLDENDSGGARKMGTTMTCVCIHPSGILVAHIGDSRIYQFRPSSYDKAKGCLGILYQSEDHSLVNDLLKIGEITPEEAETFPRRNVITRAMQPGQERRAKADVFVLDDVQTGDYIFMCSDGILEQLSNACLAEILADTELSDEEKLARIKTICDGDTRDNNTCVLIPIGEVEADDLNDFSYAEQDMIEAVSDDVTEDVEQAGVTVADKPFSHDSHSRIIWAVLITITLISLVYYVTVRFRKTDKDNETVTYPKDAVKSGRCPSVIDSLISGRAYSLERQQCDDDKFLIL